MKILLLSLIIAQSPPPDIHAVHFIPGDVPSLVITGRHLWVGSEADAVQRFDAQRRDISKRNTVKVNGITGEWSSLSGASSNDANRGLSCIQSARFHGGLSPSPSAKVEFTRFDGLEVSAMVLVPVNRGRTENVAYGRREVISSPIVVADGASLDLEGKTIEPSDTFSGGELIRYGRGSHVYNGRLFIPSDCSRPIVAAMRPIDITGSNKFIPPTFGAQFDALEIVDNRTRGRGIYTAGARNLTMNHCRIVAWSSIERGQYDESSANIFYECEFASPRGRYDGGLGNVLCGDHNLVWRCRWHDIDRGPTGGSWGSPQFRTTWWECEQYHTGWTQGASEGILYECNECLQATAKLNGTEAFIEGVSLAPRVNWNQVKEGYFIARPDGRWATIRTNLRYQGETSFRLLLDRPINTNAAGDSIGDVRIGNGIVQNNFIRCRFTHGKSGLFFFGMALDNYVGGCAFHDLRGGVIHRQFRSSAEWAFGVNTTDRVNFFRGVDQPWVTIQSTNDWPPRN